MEDKFYVFSLNEDRFEKTWPGAIVKAPNFKEACKRLGGNYEPPHNIKFLLEKVEKDIRWEQDESSLVSALKISELRYPPESKTFRFKRLSTANTMFDLILIFPPEVTSQVFTIRQAALVK